ncbi:hypothetical protein ABT324_10810 [Saccharopolyspora sp. NPDC000359]|uniref:hypothetical protein n=1 Tax=Saccharopolyspora sp. NPDC000359 TaxID=3154251 RepID=UPI00332591FF
MRVDDEYPTTPMRRIPQRRDDQRSSLVAGVLGLVLIATPLIVFSQVPGTGDAPPEGSSTLQQAQVSAQPAAAVQLTGDRDVVLFARAQDGSVLRHLHSSSPIEPDHGWVNLGGSAAGDPVAVTDAFGRLAAFFVGTDGALWMSPDVSPTAAAAPWRELGGPDLTGRPAAVQDARGRLAVVARSADGTLWESHQTEPAGETWSDWRDLAAHSSTDPAIHRDPRGVLRVFAVGADGRMAVLSQTGLGTWSEPTDLGGSLTTSPSVVVDRDGRLQVFARGADGSLQHNAETNPGAGWAGWHSAGGDVAGPPLAVLDARGTVVVFAATPRGAVEHTWGVEALRHGLNKWVSIGGNTAELTAVTKDALDELVVFAIGKRGGMEEAHQENPAAGPWSTWSTEPGGVFIPD